MCRARGWWDVVAGIFEKGKGRRSSQPLLLKCEQPGKGGRDLMRESFLNLCVCMIKGPGHQDLIVKTLPPPNLG